MVRQGENQTAVLTLDAWWPTRRWRDVNGPISVPMSNIALAAMEGRQPEKLAMAGAW